MNDNLRNASSFSRARAYFRLRMEGLLADTSYNNSPYWVAYVLDFDLMEVRFTSLSVT